MDRVRNSIEDFRQNTRRPERRSIIIITIIGCIVGALAIAGGILWFTHYHDKRKLKPLEEKNKQKLFEIYNQCINGYDVSQMVREKVSENVRVNLQQIIDEKCAADSAQSKHHPNGRWPKVCYLSNSKIISNELLKALDYFGKSIAVPDYIEQMTLRGLGLTSLWLKFGKDSKIWRLSIKENNFKKLSHETFAKFIHETARQKLKEISINANKYLKEIDFDELMVPNIETFNAGECESLDIVKNIPRSMKDMGFEFSGIRYGDQLQFKNKDGNKLEWIYCDLGCEEEFKKVFVRLYPDRKIEWHIEGLGRFKYASIGVTFK